jgi:hypothetical protein
VCDIGHPALRLCSQDDGDFRSNEKSHIMATGDTLTMQHVSNDGKVTPLRKPLPVQVMVAHHGIAIITVITATTTIAVSTTTTTTTTTNHHHHHHQPPQSSSTAPSVHITSPVLTSPCACLRRDGVTFVTFVQLQSMELMRILLSAYFFWCQSNDVDACVNSRALMEDKCQCT